MGKPLEIAEHYGKWAVVIGAALLFLRRLWKFIVKTYEYIKRSNERFEMLQSILDNQEYDKMERQAIMNKISLGYFRTDREGKSIEIGDVVCKVFGYTEAELLKFGWSTYIHPDDRGWVMASIIEDIKFKRNGDLKYRIIAANEEVKKVHVVAKQTGNSYFCTLEVIK